MAESGGCSAAVNPTDNDGTQTSWGLWQISNGTHSQPVSGILAPATNAQQAVAKYNAADGFSPWGTYTSGAYKQFYSGSTTPDTNVPTASGGGSSSPGADDPATCLVGFGEGGILGIGSTSVCLFKKSEARALVGGMLVGGGFLVMGLGVALIAVFALGRSGAARTVINLTPLGGAASRAVPAPRKPPQPRPAPQPEPSPS